MDWGVPENVLWKFETIQVNANHKTLNDIFLVERFFSSKKLRTTKDRLFKTKSAEKKLFLRQRFKNYFFQNQFRRLPTKVILKNSGPATNIRSASLKEKKFDRVFVNLVLELSFSSQESSRN